ncbi:hypothetical protein BH24CHL1_BH24CHL1_09420 [soil metagenome]
MCPAKTLLISLKGARLYALIGDALIGAAVYAFVRRRLLAT